MTLDQIAGQAQDSLLEVMQTVKVLKEEVVRLNARVQELELQIEVPDLTLDTTDE